MLDCTDRHDRYLLRLISSKVVLYTEMITTGALLFGDTARFLNFDVREQPVALQLGGSEPDAMTRCAELAQKWCYNEVNINVGCPSDRVQSGRFGACLMQDPNLVAENIRQMQAAIDLPVTVKCRLGVDEQNPREALWRLVSDAADAGCHTFLVHARKAWLSGLSPKENRNVPPLDYELVYQLKAEFPELEIVLNGGITSLAECANHLDQVDGVMMGREAYANPYILSEVDQAFYGVSKSSPSRDEVLEHYIEYIDQRMAEGARLNTMSRHAVGLYSGEPSSRLWRRHISERAHKAGADTSVMRDAWKRMMDARNTNLPDEAT